VNESSVPPQNVDEEGSAVGCQSHRQQMPITTRIAHTVREFQGSLEPILHEASCNGQGGFSTFALSGSRAAGRARKGEGGSSPDPRVRGDVEV
jgi:hypothetical protein